MERFGWIPRKVIQVFHLLLCFDPTTDIMTTPPPPPMGTTIIKKIDTAGIPKLGDDNYVTWKCQVSLILKSNQVWSVVDGSEKKPATNPDKWIEKDIQAMATIVTTVSPKQLNHIADLDSALKMWDKLRDLHSDASVYNKQLTQSKFFNYSIKRGQSVTDAFSEIEGLSRRLRDIGIVLDDSTVVAKIVSALPDEDFAAFKSAWDSVPDADQTLSRLLARLKKVELELKEKAEAAIASGEAEVAFKSQHKGQKKKNKGGNSNPNNPNGNGGNNPNPNGNGSGSSGNKKERRPNVKCYNCNKMGHFKRDCWGLQNQNQNQNQDQQGSQRQQQGRQQQPQQQGGQGGQSQGRQQRQQPREQEDDGWLSFMTREQSDESARKVTKEEVWYSDSGASCHFVGHKSWFINYRTYSTPTLVILSDGHYVSAEGEGTVALEAYINNKWRKVTFQNVAYIPGGQNLFSEGVMAQKGYLIVRDKFRTTFKRNGKPGLEAIYYKKNYIMKFRPLDEMPTAFSSQNVHNAKLWHQRLAHINMKYLRNSVKKNAIRGIELKELKNDVDCEACILGKATRSSPPEVEAKGYKVGEYLHVDLSGRIPIKSLHGSEYFLVVKDDASTFRYIIFIKQKSDVNKKMQNCIKLLENQTGNKVKRIRSDNGTEFVNKEQSAFYQEKGIVHETTAPYTPESNGRAERDMRTIKELARTMLIDSQLPKNLWEEAVGTAVYVLNRTLNSRTEKATAFEQIFKKAPFMGHIKIFGSAAFPLVPNPKALDAKSTKMYLVGYDTLLPNYRLYDSEKHCIVRARHVHFMEKAEHMPLVLIDTYERPQGEQWDGEDEETNNEEVKVDPGEAETDEEDFMDAPEDDEPTFSPVKSQGKSPLRAPPSPARSEVSTTSTASGREGLRNREQIKRPEIYDPSWKQPKRAHFAIKTPLSFGEACSSPEKEEWMEAMKEEIASLKQHKTWKLVKPPQNARILQPKWVYRIKEDNKGNPVKFKARLCVKGFMQREGIDYFDTFASVTRYESIRLLLKLAVAKGMTLTQFDVKCAFLNGKLNETIFMAQPEGFEERDLELVCLLLQALYGLKQSPKCWQEALTKAMHGLGLSPTLSDPCVFKNDLNTIIAALWVDDGLVIGQNKEEVMKFLDKLATKFEITIMDPDQFVGMHLVWEENSLFISQAKYVAQLLEKYNMQDCKSSPYPMQLNLDLTKADESDEEIPFRQIIGSLLFLARVTRPDIMFAVNRLAQFSSGFNEEHFYHAKQILRYLKGTQEFGLRYERGQMQLEGYTDADFASDRLDRKSTSGFAFFLGDSLISWTSEKQSIVSLSSTEAEYIALSTGAKEALWLRQFLNELGAGSDSPTKVLVDNTSTINLAKNPILSKRSKHIDIRFHHTRELVEKGDIKLDYIPTQEQKADILTKAMTGAKFSKQRNMLGLVSLTFVTLFCCGVDSSLFHETGPVVWREVPNPVASGVDRVYLKIKLKSPCGTMNEMVSETLLPAAIKICEQLYQDMILQEMNSFCPQRPHHHSLTERELVTIGLIALAAVVVVGLGTTAGVAVYKSQENEGKISILTTNLNLTEDKLNGYFGKYNNLVDVVESLDTKIEGLYNTTVPTTFSLAAITTKLIMGNAITKEAAEAWKEGEISQKLFDYWNVTLPCKKDCPIKYGSPISCDYLNETNTFYLNFEVPTINKKRKVLVAEPFTMMMREQGKTCSIHYEGPKLGIREQGENGVNCFQSIYGSIPEKKEALLYLGQKCNATAMIRNATSYSISHCSKTAAKDNLGFTQLKHISQFTIIYCPYSTIQVGEVEHECPEMPFMVPAATPFKLNGMQYTGTMTSLTVKGSPAIQMEASWNLTPPLNLTHLKEDPIHFPKMPEGGAGSSALWTWVIGGVAILAVLGLAMIAGCVCWGRCCGGGKRELLPVRMMKGQQPGGEDAVIIDEAVYQ